MNPEANNQQQSQPTPQPLTPAEIVAQSAASPILPTGTAKKKPSLVLPIILMAWPAVALILAIALYAIVNLLMTTSAPAPSGGDEASLFGESESNPLRSILNIFLFFVGAAAVGLGPISFIAGIVILIKRIKK